MINEGKLTPHEGADPDTRFTLSYEPGFDRYFIRARRGEFMVQEVVSGQVVNGAADYTKFCHRITAQLDHQLDRTMHREHIKMHNEFQKTVDDQYNAFIFSYNEIGGVHPVSRGPAPTPKEGTMSNFNTHTIYLTNRQERKARNGTLKRQEALEIITEGFLPEINLSPGDVISYEGRNNYEIVRVEGDDIIYRRLTANTAGPSGETGTTTVTKYVNDIRDGKAVLNQDDER